MIKVNSHLLSSFFLILISISLNAQSLNLYGLWFDRDENAFDTTFVYDYYGTTDTIIEQNFFAGTQNFVSLDTETGLIESVGILDSVVAVNLNNSTFNQVDRTYSFIGRNRNNDNKIFTVDVSTGNYVDYPVLVDIPLELNFDLRNGVSYGFEVENIEIGYDDETGETIFDRNLYLSSFDAVMGTNTIIGQIDSVQGVVVDGSAVNSNEGLFYFVGKDFMQNTWLYTLLLEDASIVTQTAIPDDVNYLGLVYDNMNERLLAIHQNARNLVEIDPATATHNLIAEFDFPNGTVDVFVGGTPLFDQATSTFIFVGRYENSNDLRLITLNSNTGTFINDPVLDKTVLELQVDNSNFARRFYSDPNECSESPAVGFFSCE